MVPSGKDPACQGGRPVLLYAHGATVKKTTDLADLPATEPLRIAALFAVRGHIAFGRRARFSVPPQAAGSALDIFQAFKMKNRAIV